MNKEEVKQKFIQGNKTAFDWIYANYSKAMFSICLRYTKNYDEAADILQESFIKIFEKRSLFNPDYEIGPWLKRIVINEAINHFRINKRFDLVEDNTFFDEPDEPLLIDEDSGIKEKLLKILNSLPEGYRAVFNMYVLDNLTHQEIAEYLGISVNTSKTQLFKARKMIQSKLEEMNVTRNSINNEQGI